MVGTQPTETGRRVGNLVVVVGGGGVGGPHTESPASSLPLPEAFPRDRACECCSVGTKGMIHP